MEGEDLLLDTPKKQNLQQQSKDLRGALKDFERQFVAENGRKAKQADIKRNLDIAAKYKEYHRTQDVLAGRLPLKQLNSPQVTNTSRSKKHKRTDSGLGSSPYKTSHVLYATPRKRRPSQTLDSAFAGPEVQNLDFGLATTIGPTPHRDGKVLGLFDLVSNAGSNAGAEGTPSSSARKRKIEELYEHTPAKKTQLQTAQTPSRRSPSKRKGDLLEFLAGTPQRHLDSSRKRFSRTPQSEGRKFELSQFFATPSAQRFLGSSQDSAQQIASAVPDRDFDRTPQKQPDSTGLDLTPVYMRRSTSFKDRLLSASQTPNTGHVKRAVKKIGPPTLQHFRSSTSNTLQSDEMRRSKQIHSTDDYDDDLDALREMEDDAFGSSVLVRDSQANLALSNRPGEDENQPSKSYRKKGQKRTTRKANIKPAAPKATALPEFVAPDGFDSEEEGVGVDSEVDAGSKCDYGSNAEFAESEFEDLSEGAAGKSKKLKDTTTEDARSRSKKKAGMINPNAQSHTNYRSLKIRNKNSKAKGAGRNRFGRSRR